MHATSRHASRRERRPPLHSNPLALANIQTFNEPADVAPIVATARRANVVRIVLTAWCSIAVTGIPACDPAAKTSSDDDATDAVADSLVTNPSASADLNPAETIVLLREYRAARRYDRIEPYLLPHQRLAVIAQIRAVDRLHASADMFRRRVGERFGLAAAQEFDYRQVANVLGVFSQDVAIGSTVIDHGRATVSYQVKQRIPLDAARLDLVDGRWTLIADPIEGVAAELLNLGFLLGRIARDLDDQNLTVEQLRDDLRLRESPILRRLAALVNRELPATDAGAG